MTTNYNFDKYTFAITLNSLILSQPVTRITVYCGEYCTDTGLTLHQNEVGVDRVGRFHFPFIIIGPRLKSSISLVEAIIAFINVSIYFATILWILALYGKTDPVHQYQHNNINNNYNHYDYL